MDTPSLVIVGRPLLLQDDVAALRAEGDLDRVGEGVETRSRPRRASSSYAIILDIAVWILRLGNDTFSVGQCPRRTTSAVRA